MEHVTERLQEPFGGLDETVFGPTPLDTIGWELKDIYTEVMKDWAPDIPSAAGPAVPGIAMCMHVLRKHTYTDPDTGVTKHDYITRELQEEGLE